MSTGMKSRDEIDVAAQMRFGSDGLEVDEETDTDLSDWGIVDPGQERETRIEKEAASEFGVDDRSVVEQEQQTEQDQLFISRDEKQKTLAGGKGGMEAQYGD